MYDKIAAGYESSQMHPISPSEGVGGGNLSQLWQDRKINQLLIDKFTRTIEAMKAEHQKVKFEEPPPFYNEASEFTGIS